MAGTFWAFAPAVVAIVLALITKKVYPSLFAGIIVGALLFAEGNIINAFSYTVMIIGEKLGENGGILVFLVVLGIFAVILARTGATGAYGAWAKDKIKTRKGALLSTVGLGSLIFVDDYFNCLTVGEVMRPVSDKHGISRSKLAYIIDSTAAPICIIAPISSWAAAVSGFLDSDNAIVAFIMTIPFNLYALLTIAMMVAFILLKIDFGKMKRNQDIADKTGDLLAGETELPAEDIGIEAKKGGYLDAALFVEQNMQALKDSGIAIALIPAIFFIIACLISFATGTSWGTFGILIPVATSILGTSLEPGVILAVSAILAGAVYGDQVSPISDTTIMASSGAQCNHIDHVKTQLPYASLVAAVSFVAYLIAGAIVASGLSYGIAALVTLLSGFVLLAAAVAVIWYLEKKKAKVQAE